MTTPRKMPNKFRHDVEDADAEAMAALRELLPVLRGEKDMRFVLASTVDRLHKVHEILKAILFDERQP